MSKSRLPDLFPDEETFQRIYSECLENESYPTESITPSDKDLTLMFDRYLSAVQAQTFKYAYQCGYIASKREGPKRHIKKLKSIVKKKVRLNNGRLKGII